MGVSLKCPECRAKLTVPDKFSGRGLVCPLCSTRLKVQEIDDVYQIIQDDSPSAPISPNYHSAEPSRRPSIVKVVIQNADHPAKKEPSWAAKHVLEMLFGVAGTIVAAALLTFFGLSGRESGKDAHPEKLAPVKAKDQPVEVKAQQMQQRQEPRKTPAMSDSRVRWVNTSYNTTISHVGGQLWLEIDNTTRKRKSELIEQTRTSDYIELKGRLGTFLGVVRLRDKQMDMLKNGKWEWSSNGSWVNTTTK